MTIRLHPATTHGDRLHLLAFQDAIARADMEARGWSPHAVAFTVCGVRFAWGSWKGARAVLQRCTGCFA